MAKELFVSEATVRRDIRTLEKQGLVKRVYGGVMLSKYASASDPPLLLREQDQRPQKELIAAKAASLLHNGAAIIMDVRIFCTGGSYIPRKRALAGAAAIEMLKTIHADYMFFLHRVFH